VSARRAAAISAVVVGVLACYLAFVGAVGLPGNHNFYDPVGIRDGGTVWTALSWRPADGRHFLPAAVLGHIEGPLQFTFLNAYYHLVGDALPLDPLTTQLPNTAAAIAGVLLIVALGTALESRRLGLSAAVVLSTMPWLGVALRFPWVFVTFSVALELAVLLAYLQLFRHPDRRRWLAPLCLAGYLTSALDWPSFLPVLALFAWRSGGLRSALRNRYNALPLGVVVVYVGWAAALFAYGRLINPDHAHLYLQTLLIYPFAKVSAAAGWPSAWRLAQYAALSIGPALVLAVAGAIARPLAPRAGEADRASRALWLALTAWLAVFTLPLLRQASSVTYGYVVAVPIALLAGWLLARVPARATFMALGALALAAVQVAVVASGFAPTKDWDEPRVLAAAAYLAGERADLLAAERRALFVGDPGASAGQHARGAHQRLYMPLGFPDTLALTGVGSKEALLRAFVEGYRDRGELAADWVLLPVEALLTPGRAGQFYLRLAGDPRMAWTAAFWDTRGRILWLGERTGERTGSGSVLSLLDAPRQDVPALSAVYRARYDRISFLKRNVRVILHY
jgi:hypothetical protein